MTVTVAAALVLGWPLFKFIVGSPSVLTLTLVQVILGILLAFYFGPLPALLAEMFPSNSCSTGMPVSFNTGVTILGGFALLILT
jgi:MHS family proline/betaine transporter-like MFS transporter